MVNAFTVSVSQSDWDDGLGGWRCSVLAIPGAKVEAVYDKGHKIDDSWYEALVDHRVLRWIREERPERITVSISLTEELSTQIETSRWKKLAILLPAAATVFSATITASLPRLFEPTQSISSSIPLPESANKGTVFEESGDQSTELREPKIVEQKRTEVFPISLENVNISFPRGDKVIIRWKDMPEDKPGTEILRKVGVSIDEVNDGSKLAYAALARRNPETIHYVPLASGGKLANGHSSAVLPSGPSQNAGYDEFQLFQNETEFRVVLLPIGLNFPPLEPSEVGINWEYVRAGLRRALNAMYEDKKSIEFENVGVYSKGEAYWEYRIPYRVLSR